MPMSVYTIRPKSHHADVVRCNWVEFSSEEEVERDILWQYPDKYNQLIDLKKRRI